MTTNIETPNPPDNNSPKSNPNMTKPVCLDSGLNSSYPECHNEHGNQKKKSCLEWVTLGVAVGALIVSVFAVLFTCEQSKTMKDTEIRQLRAYVSINMLTKATGNFITEKRTQSFMLTNRGQTPAKILEIGGEINIFPFPLTSKFKPIYPKDTSFQQIFISFPSEKDSTWVFHIDANRIFSKNEIDECNRIGSKNRIYLFVRIIYKDVFDSIRKTSMCFMVQEGGIKENYFGSIWIISNRFNDFD